MGEETRREEVRDERGEKRQWFNETICQLGKPK